ncbi:sensor histidine kinase [Cohnella lupini]|uniref:Two-component system sensor histidine kinase YesM n=1 Tax=Cohnella lupini TaxID=1294267 RepID=A0A3D9I5Y3_9BACL|nr:histidine kinase [Cohnella lupini]RED56596.1 two-component system sensor histidine kinase YesM [Cohnella lupini]
MTSFDKLKTMTLFPKLVIALLVLIAPLYILGLYVNKQGSTSIREELSRSLQSKVTFYMNSLESEKDHITNLQQEMLIDSDLQHINFISAIMSPFEWTQTIQRVENKLQFVKGSSEYIQNVSVHMLTIGRTLSSNRPITDELSPDYAAVKEPVIRSDGSSQNGTIKYREGRLFQVMQYPEPPVADRPPSYVMGVEWSVSKLRLALQQFADSGVSGALLFQPTEGWMVTGVNDNENRDSLQRFLEERYDKQMWEGVAPMNMGDTSYLIAFKYSHSFQAYLSVYVPQQEVLGQLDKYRWLYWLLSGVSSLIIIVYSYWLYRLLHKPMTLLIRTFRRMEEGQLDLVVLPRRKDEFFNLYMHFNKMVDRLRVLIHQVLEQKIRAQSSELKQLQSQINPHFLYNTYFILYRLAKMNDIENVTLLSQHLGEYFQYITRNSDSEVRLEDEVRHSRTYVEIQNIRFARRIEVRFDELPATCNALSVPRLILQPILENAYHYGMEGKRKDGKIAVSFQLNDRALFVRVEDNGDRLSEEKLSELQMKLRQAGGEIEYTGMMNVHRRLQLKYGDGSGITVDRSEWGGLSVVLRIDIDSATEQRE